MKNLDKHFLAIQFRLMIYSKKGSEFQSFAEAVFSKAYQDFEKVRPYGNLGDGGNDGFRRKPGIYFQIYGPKEPTDNDGKAANKLIDDFGKLKNTWNEIANIQKYIFVFNDCYHGTTLPIENAIHSLKSENPAIKFELLLAKDLEKLFFSLTEEDFFDLGFKTDSREAFLMGKKTLENIQVMIDRENSKLALRILESSQKTISDLANEDLVLEMEIMHAKCLSLLEKPKEAKAKLESLTLKFPQKNMPLLLLAQALLLEGDYDGNLELLNRVENISPNDDFLAYQKLNRRVVLNEEFSFELLTEANLPVDSRLRSSFFLLYAKIAFLKNDILKAKEFVEKAIALNKNRILNRIFSLHITEWELSNEENLEEKEVKGKTFISSIKAIHSEFSEFGEISVRSRLTLEILSLSNYIFSEDYDVLEDKLSLVFELIFQCVFNKQIDFFFCNLFQIVQLTEDKWHRFLAYIESSHNMPSKGLCNEILLHFLCKGKIFHEGKQFFLKLGSTETIEFIENLENENIQEVKKHFEMNSGLAFKIAAQPQLAAKLRRAIIEDIKTDESFEKSKLNFYLLCDEKKYSEAFNVLKEIPLRFFSSNELPTVIKLANKMSAWDLEIEALKIVLAKEKAPEKTTKIRLQLFRALVDQKNYLEIINNGLPILELNHKRNCLNEGEKEFVLAHTILSCLIREKIEPDVKRRSLEILRDFKLEFPSFEFKAGVEAEAYIQNQDYQKAIEAVIEGVKIKKTLSDQEYAKIYFIFIVKIGNQTDLNLDSLPIIEANTFVKVKSKERWYFVGDEEALDAIKISKGNPRFNSFIDGKLGEEISFKNKYSSNIEKEQIERIFTIEKYVLWRAGKVFVDSSAANAIEGVQMIETPGEKGNVDLSNLYNFMEDLEKSRRPFFDFYCENTIPLAMLASAEGSLNKALCSIYEKERGFVNFSMGTEKEFGQQILNAKNVVTRNQAFYLDGTSAFFLTESGLLEEIFHFLPNVKTTRSVVNFLIELTEYFETNSEKCGYLGYKNGKLTYKERSKEDGQNSKAKFLNVVKLLESKPENISDISLANKHSSFSEQEILPELCDPCIFSQKENIPILTEDFLYLQINALETLKEQPEHFSSLALIRLLLSEKRVSFERYLDYFAYLSFYRFRFLSFNSNDLERAIFGDERNLEINLDNLKKFNFALTLSEKYGVSLENGFSVIGNFLFSLFLNQAIFPEMLERIFIEVVNLFPCICDKRFLAQSFVRFLAFNFRKREDTFSLKQVPIAAEEKIKRLIGASKIF